MEEIDWDKAREVSMNLAEQEAKMLLKDSTVDIHEYLSALKEFQFTVTGSMVAELIEKSGVIEPKNAVRTSKYMSFDPIWKIRKEMKPGDVDHELGTKGVDWEL